MTTLTRLLLLTTTTLIGCAIGQEIERQRQRRDMEDILSSTRTARDDLREAPAQASDAVTLLGESVVYVDTTGAHYSARIVRIVDPVEQLVDLHVDRPNQERPVHVVTLVPPRPAGSTFAHTWITRHEAAAALN
ncbi:hypothetical protein [Deinococcus soli (ex Cha et al. 2016)]|uniref:hypothetical protein n=1 Tax=Deinococcus soli (ex Cha et al. 2016) TaxID=1309411 RepID=UPI001667747A|nr:hypothetical protein [Deinococcus soli (ex Cha et al. 2016)]GGB69079.1 hypothetical protein GCM10008019_26620 [Deinococcus soli (ex Cha et al. 2016)]